MDPAPQTITPRRQNAILCWEFMKISALVLGGGYVIMSAVESRFVRERHWLTSDEMMKIVTVAQTVPGILACNCAVGVGFQLGRYKGAIAALIGTLIPPITVVIAIASVLSLINIENPYIQGAFLGLNACIVGLILSTAIRFARKKIHTLFDIAILLGVIIANRVFLINPAILLSVAIVVGLLYTGIRAVFAQKAQEEKA